MFSRVLKSWLPLAAGLTLLALTVHVAVQQAHRMMANDPQIQLAEDAAKALGDRMAPDSVIPKQIVELNPGLEPSLAPFVIVFDSNGKPLASSATLTGTTLVPPSGVFDYTRTHGEDRFTWQPEYEVRIAAVMKKVERGGSGFVLAGRSLREVEKRERDLGSITLLGWIGALAASFIIHAGVERFSRPNGARSDHSNKSE